MSFDWKDFIRLAEKLTQTPDEASLRSAISRAYYGVFCITRNKKGLNHLKHAGVHQEVIKRYKNSNDPNEQKIGIFLDKLRDSRNKADYDENANVNLHLVQRVLIHANNILKLLGIKL